MGGWMDGWMGIFKFSVLWIIWAKPKRQQIFFLDLPRSLMAVMGLYFKLRHDRFLPDSFNVSFTTQPAILTLYILSYRQWYYIHQKQK